MSTLISIDSLQVHDVSNDMVLVAYSISTQHISASSGNIRSLSAIVSLNQGYHFWIPFLLVL